MDGFEQIDELVEAYYQGMYAGDADLLRRVFDPSARICGFFADRFLNSDLEAFVQAMASGPTPLSLGQEKHLETIDVRRDGNVATAVVRDTVRGMTFVDHLALVRGTKGWKAVNKIYVTPSSLPRRG